MTTPDDDRLRALLRQLPDATPRPGFAAGVRRLADAAVASRRHRALPPWLPLRAAAVAALVALVAGGVAWRAALDAREHRRIERLRAEHARLARDLAQVRQLAAEPSLVVVEVGDAREVVLDPGLLPGPAAAGTSGARAPVVPVTF